MKKIITLSLFLFSLQGAYAGVTASSNGIITGKITSVSVRTDIKEIAVELNCGGQKGYIKFNKKSFAEGNNLVNSIGKFFSAGMYRTNLNSSQHEIAQYRISASLPTEPGSIVCE